MSPKTIYFEKNTATYSEFHNFSQHDVTYNGKRYPTGEHLYQAFKVMDAHPDIAERIRNCGDSALSAFNMGHNQYQRWIRSDWSQVQVQKMEIVQDLKFTQHANLKALLLSTGDAELVLDSPRDFWGIGTNRSGRNELGKILMRLRGKLRQGQNGGSSSLCEFCHKKPKFQNHPYCGKTCASEAAKGNNGAGSASSGPLKNGCLVCGKSATKGPKGHFCSDACILKAETGAPRLIEIPSTHDTFDNVTNQFKRSWRHPTACPTVSRVYKIIERPSSFANYEQYKATIESRGKFMAAGQSAGNENRRWHGTTRDCLLGDSGHTSLCKSTACSLCGIINTSYKLDLFGKKTGWGRFGRGIYTSSTSSKANDYSKNLKTSNLKAVILNKVVVGKGYKVSQNDSSLTAPPPGYDSVLGEVVKGGVLNYDELVSYTENAIRPSYLVTYNA